MKRTPQKKALLNELLIFLISPYYFIHKEAFVQLFGLNIFLI
ncbi:hypothetical protein LMOf2365_2001 [Listeria monocytogenes serotype 4b str. F2365]|nr:hypothetical protein LMOf2365_2001 [Listeria monocytogenes serotype 4b str. F2365]CUK28071.1 conserved hypothetical protein [Listeria monocytogenes]CUK34189.1 conserved hypothetical protein [Listeria monocytogenes]CUK40603.1 conserved hypothetical protein [Listeria monocytogenes]CUK44226.1 conserved hypothetical protein [Listeria monocytogenes]